MELHEYSGRRWVVVNGEKISDPRMLARHLPSPNSEQGLVGFCRAAIFLLFGRAFHVIADPLTYRQKANAKLHPRSAMKDTANLESTRIMELDLESIEPPRVSEDLVFFVEDCFAIPYRVQSTPPVPFPDEFRLRFDVLPSRDPVSPRSEQPSESAELEDPFSCVQFPFSRRERDRS